MSPRLPPARELRPMLATAGRLPPDDGHTFEAKWDGVRALARWDGETFAIHTRNGREATAAYPELAGLGPALGDTPVVLDGEVVAFDERGLPSFQRLQGRMHVADARAAGRLVAATPVTYLAFDLLHLGDRSLLAEPWHARRSALEDLALAGPSWATPTSFVGEGEATLAAMQARGMEGVVAKRTDSPYQPGVRSKAWTKVVLTSRDDFVVGGWLPGAGRRSSGIGALLLGVPLPDGRLRFVGGVGTGFTDAEMRRLESVLGPTVVTESPFADALPAKAVFVRPTLVVDVVYRERTTSGILRHPSYKGTRVDKTPADVDTGA
ncbi:MAG: non-homologous end-joining DNA ligase [Acidimicrobiales bacterium]